MSKSTFIDDDYNDETEYWRNYHQDNQVKRQQNKEYSTDLLIQAGVTFREYNNGLQLVIYHEEDTIDFYPSTGLWIVRKKHYQRRGVQKLLRYLQK